MRYLLKFDYKTTEVYFISRIRVNCWNIKHKILSTIGYLMNMYVQRSYVYVYLFISRRPQFSQLRY